MSKRSLLSKETMIPIEILQCIQFGGVKHDPSEVRNN